ncbi:DNA phosphorothioation-associated putative methyltransferase [Rhodoblastus sp.]|jgi:DNA phosphorothioation-associated putative methyltransferase|uniref:DNA phosphorothioation-associated putative methyltransferase n=1 Tax=Rhodoblastus sp. TaxID=1962975 RepID=UPI0025E6EC27|nr:DNA phosphorothioation-associated putative methyltransferase [Rhodoblastus sp.]
MVLLMPGKAKNVELPWIEGAMTSRVGKVVGGSVYVHRSAVDLLPEVKSSAVALAERIACVYDWNVARIADGQVSLLVYESFDESGFPALLSSAKVGLGSGEVVYIDYLARINPPILHRKELLLRSDDPRIPKFRALTAAAEDHGLFREANKIGTRKAWEKAIADAGLVLKGHSLIRVGDEHFDVFRHKTAIVRGDVSQPMQIMLRLGLVAKESSVFDYGCGQGEDVAALLSQGYDAFGWDPHHAAGGPRRLADVVNLGFVLNVIEDQRERLETLKAAWGFANKALCVSVMLQRRVSTAGQKPHRDGFLTSRGTFQKYFAQQELREFVEGATGQATLGLAPGIVVVFKDKDLEQEILFRRRSRAFLIGSLPRPPRREREINVRPELRERVAPMLEALRGICLTLGRLPEPDEVPKAVLDGADDAHISWTRLIEALHQDVSDDQDFVEAARTRREDLLVHLALQQFPGSPKYRSLPKSLQIDIKAFFKSHTTALAEGRQLLFAAGDRAGVRADVEAALAAGLGGLRRDRRFRFRSSVLTRLPARLRVVVGCAEVLQGGADACDFIDLDLEAPKVTMLTCDDADQPVPCIVEKLRIDMARLRVSLDKRDQGSSPIYFKSRYLPADAPERSVQMEFESELRSTGLFVDQDAEPHLEDVVALLPSLALSRLRAL